MVDPEDRVGLRTASRHRGRAVVNGYAFAVTRATKGATQMHASRVVSLIALTFLWISTVAYADCLLIASRTLQLRVHQGTDELGDGPLIWEGWLGQGESKYITAPDRIRYYYRFDASGIWQSLGGLCRGGAGITVP